MKTIKGRIARLVIIFSVVSIVCVGGVSVFLNYSSTNNMLKQTMTETANLGAERVNQELDKYKVITMEVGSVARLANTETAIGDKKVIIDQRVSTHGFVSGDILDSNGKSIFNGMEYNDKEYYKEAIKGNAYISEPVLNKENGKMTVAVAAPLWKGGIPGSEVVGVIAFVPKETILSDIMSEIKISNGSSASMIDKNGNTIACVDSEKVKNAENIGEIAKENNQLTALAAIHQKMKNGETGFGTYTYDNIEKLLAYAPVRDTNGWSFGVTAPASDFMKTTTNSIYIIVGMLLLCILVAVVVGFWVGGKIGSPITACAERLEKLSSGDLKAAVPEFKSNDETGVLADATIKIVNSLNNIISDVVNVLSELSEGNLTVSAEQQYEGDFVPIRTATEKILLSLNTAMSQINETSIQVSGGSDQVSSGAQALAQGATEQASSIQELSASIAEIEQQVNRNAEDAEKAKVLSKDAKAIMHGSVVDMDLARQAMDEISATSKDISKVIKTIDDIAFQTNILALNAAVEAARAGAAGKGFAVVADEVRNLSQKSAEAAKNTTALIESSIEAVKKGTQLVRKTSESFAEVAAKSDEVSKIVEEISIMAQQQAMAVSQVSIGIEQVSSVVQMNSATSEESAAASEELSGQAQMLKTLVDQFKLNDVL